MNKTVRRVWFYQVIRAHGNANTWRTVYIANSRWTVFISSSWCMCSQTV